MFLVAAGLEHDLFALRRPIRQPCCYVIDDGLALSAVDAYEINHSILNEEDALPVRGNNRASDRIGNELQPLGSVAPAAPQGAIRV